MGCVQSTRSNHAPEPLERSRRHVRRRSGTNLSLSAIIDDLEREVEKTREAWKQEIAELKRSHEEVIERLKRDHEALESKLFKRERIQGLTDTEAAALFRELANQVDAVSRELQAKYAMGSKTIGSFSEHTLQLNSVRVHGSTRKVKLAILQDVIWSILLDRIFATPFQIFGPNGLSLQKQWTEEFEEDLLSSARHQWPKPTLDSEKWRAKAVEDRMILATQTSGPDSNDDTADMTKYIAAISNKVHEKLSLLLLPRTMSLECLDVESIVNKAVNVWLKLASQRCRFIVSRSDEIYTWADKETAKPRCLVICPKLVRKGDAYGYDFESEEIVRDCGGKTLKLFESI